MNIAGSGIHDSSVRFRMYAIVLAGISAFGALLFWRAQEFTSAEYVDFPAKKVISANETETFTSENYRLKDLSKDSLK